MAVSKQEIIYTVKADTGEIEKALETVSKDAEKTADSIDDVGKSMDKAGSATNILTDKLDSLTGGAVSGFKKAATGTKAFITGLKLTRGAIIATGIGALVVGIVALVKQFGKTEEGARKLAKAFAPVRAVIDVLQQKISALGGAIFKLFTGDFRGAADDLTRALGNQNNEYQRQIDLYSELIDREQALEDARIRQTVATAKTRAEIKELNLVAEDLTKSLDEREAAAERAGQLERELFEERKRIAQEELAIAQARLESSNTTTEDREKAAELEAEIFRLEQESLELQTTLNNKLNTIRAEGIRQREAQAELTRKEREEAQKAAQAELAARQKLEDELFALTLTAQEREELAVQQKFDERVAIAGDDEGLLRAATERLQADLAAIEQKFRKQEEEAGQQENAAKLAELDKYLQEASALLESQEEPTREGELEDIRQNYAEQIALAQSLGQDTLALTEAQRAAELEINKKYDDLTAESSQRAQQAKLDVAKQTLGALAALNDAFAGDSEVEQKKAFERSKKIQTAQALISTYESAVQAFKSLAGIPVVGPALGTAASVAAIASGLAQVKSIQSQTIGGDATTPPPAPPPALSAAATEATQAPAAPVLDLSFLGDIATTPQPQQAFVISENVTTAQQANKKIQDQAAL